MQVANSAEARLFEEGEKISVKYVDGSVSVSLFDHTGYIDFAGAW